MQSPTDARYAAMHLPPEPEDQDLRALVEPYQAIIVLQFRAILDRTERSEYYPWIDTKIDLITGKDFPPVHPLLRRDLISGWVQGRGLEAMAGFARVAGALPAATPKPTGWRSAACAWRPTCSGSCGSARGERRASALLHDRDGRGDSILDTNFEREPLLLDAGSPHSYSDLFCAKGMYAAANLLDDATAAAEARAFCIAVCRDIFSACLPQRPAPAGRRRSGLDSGAYSHGPAMICARDGRAASPGSSRDPRAWGWGWRWPGMSWTATSMSPASGRSFASRTGGVRGRRGAALRQTMTGRMISDPGHSLEFVGPVSEVQPAGAARRRRHCIPGRCALRRRATHARPAESGVRQRLPARARRHLQDRRPAARTAPWTTRCPGGACPRRSGPRWGRRGARRGRKRRRKPRGQLARSWRGRTTPSSPITSGRTCT